MEHAEALLKAIRFFGSETAMGKALNISQQRISYWVNNSRQISYDYVLKIEAYTKGYVTRHELAPDKKEVNQLVGNLVEINVLQGLSANKKQSPKNQKTYV
jgi:DNA-binding transcriptional regulator YdaS (Cro superfamily)